MGLSGTTGEQEWGRRERRRRGTGPEPGRATACPTTNECSNVISLIEMKSAVGKRLLSLKSAGCASANWQQGRRVARTPARYFCQDSPDLSLCSTTTFHNSVPLTLFSSSFQTAYTREGSFLCSSPSLLAEFRTCYQVLLTKVSLDPVAIAA